MFKCIFTNQHFFLQSIKSCYLPTKKHGRRLILTNPILKVKEIKYAKNKYRTSQHVQPPKPFFVCFNFFTILFYLGSLDTLFISPCHSFLSGDPVSSLLLSLRCRSSLILSPISTNVYISFSCLLPLNSRLKLLHLPILKNGWHVIAVQFSGNNFPGTQVIIFLRSLVGLQGPVKAVTTRDLNPA